MAKDIKPMRSVKANDHVKPVGPDAPFSEEATNGYSKMKRLRTAMEWSSRKLQPFRRNRLEAIRQYVGAHYSDSGASDKVPVNMIEMAVNIYTRQLVANNPKVLISTMHRELKPQAANFELALNRLVQEIKLKNTIKKSVMNAFFGLGVIKKGLTYGDQIEMFGRFHDIGQPFADNVDLDDWIHDMSAKTWEHVTYMGNRYRLPYEYVMDSDDFNNKDTLKSSMGYQQSTNEGGDERAQNITRGQNSDPDEYMDQVELWDIYLPYENKIVTLPCYGDGSNENNPAIRVAEWDGPESGPYSVLTFSDVPSNLMPLPPVALLMDLHTLSNKVFRKLGRQANRQKTVLGVSGGAMDDGERVRDANDGEIIRTDHPDKMREFRFGGVDNVNLAFFIQVKQLFSYFGGNLDSLGGLAAQTDTVGQDKLIGEASGQRIADMQDKVHDFTKEIVKDIGWYLWYDPLIEMPLTKRIDGVGIDVPVLFSPETKEGDFIDYNLDIALYSMQEQTPSMKLKVITDIFTNFVAPFIPMLEAQGMGVDFEGFMSLLSKFTNTPELDEIITFMEGQGSLNKGQIVQPGKPAQTKRTYERINRPGATGPGKDMAAMQALLSGANEGQQTSQAAGMFR